MKKGRLICIILAVATLLGVIGLGSALLFKEDEEFVESGKLIMSISVVNEKMAPQISVVSGTESYCNAGDTAAYTTALQSGTLPPGSAEELDPATRRTELLGLRLRTDEGLPPELLRPQDKGLVEMLIQEELASLRADGSLLLTLRGRLLADEIAVQLLG